MRRILIVEDNHLVYDAINSAFLLKGGFAVDYAGDGEVALAALEREKFDLAIIDVWLPKNVSGLAIARRAAARNIPVILMSGYPDVIARPEMYGFPLLPKPFRVSGLVDRFDEVIAEATRLLASTRDEVEVEAAPAPGAAATRYRFLSNQWLRLCETMTLGSLAAKG